MRVLHLKALFLTMIYCLWIQLNYWRQFITSGRNIQWNLDKCAPKYKINWRNNWKIAQIVKSIKLVPQVKVRCFSHNLSYFSIISSINLIFRGGFYRDFTVFMFMLCAYWYYFVRFKLSYLLCWTFLLSRFVNDIYEIIRCISKLHPL